jgi:hypothetical protein
MRVKTTKHTFPWEFSKIPKFNLTAESFPKTTHQDQEWSIYSVETPYGINSVMSKLMTFVKNAETGRFLFLMVLILSCFTCS